ncbi:GDSL-type esterase/lipase family protein [Sphingobacterium faecale]|uniref:SGNH hydrolase-type esterase domain-containing protein n=1 Tax=Sphingobacterium faecale TaxID=2803775 RepID=A0ABS1R9V2_9SPHI|nr:GDSL-type esterase/lipase family protein [Sphingobacterium faecale]MBL1411493.1 hypothetical protein [Sphingobacterium faecale]
MILNPLQLVVSIALWVLYATPQKIVAAPRDSISTTRPVTQNRDSTVYNWRERHDQVIALNRQRPPKVVFIGNSILHYWSGEPVSPIRRGEDAWDQYFKKKDVRNLGFGYDRIENMLWRVQNGELEGFSASHIILLAGTNNLSVNTDTEIVKGIEVLVQEIKRRQTKAKIILLGILPRKGYESRISLLNDKIAKVAPKLQILYADTGSMFLRSNGKINESLFSDGVHPNTIGYNLLAPFINNYIK